MFAAVHNQSVLHYGWSYSKAENYLIFFNFPSRYQINNLANWLNISLRSWRYGVAVEWDLAAELL